MTDLLHLFHSEKADGGDATLVQPGDWNDAHYVSTYKAALAPVVVAASDATDADKAQALLSGGSVCDGVSDQVEINASITAATAGQTVLLVSGSTGFDIRLTVVGKSGVSLKALGQAVLNCTNLPSSDHTIDYLGTEGQIDALTTSGAKFDTHVHIASTSGYAAKDLVLLYTTADWNGNIGGQDQGELFTIGSIQTDTSLTLQSGSTLQDNYTTGNSAAVCQITPVDNFVIDGLTIKNGASDNIAICILYGRQCTVRNVTINDWKAHGINFISCIDFVAENITGNRNNDQASGYLVVMDYCCQNGLVSNVIGNYSRHMVAFGIGTLYRGIARNVNVVDCVARDSGDDEPSAHYSYNCHPIGENINFINCQSFGGGGGFEHCAASGSIRNCTVIGSAISGLGISVYSSLTTVGGIEITDNIIKNIYGTGIKIETGADHTRVINNKILDCYSSGIMIETSADYCTIEGNEIFSATNNGDGYIRLSHGSYTIVRNNRMGGGATIGINIDSANAVGTILDGNYFDSSVSTPLVNSGTGTKVLGNIGYIASGEIRSGAGSLTAGVANAFTFAWQNPENQSIMILELMIDVTIAGGTALSVLDCGSAATSTTESSDLLDGVDLNATGISVSTQRVKLDASGGTTDWITGKILVAAASSLVGKYYIKYIGV